MDNNFSIDLYEEYQEWLENNEWSDEELKKIEQLNDVDFGRILKKVLVDSQLMEEIFECFEWYTSYYIKEME